MASFHSMLHRLLNISLSLEDFQSELKYILEAATVNGYAETEILKLLEKKKRKKALADLTTLRLEKDEKQQIFIPYFKNVTDHLQNEFRKLNIGVIYQNPGKLGEKLGSLKDQREDLKKSGVYQLDCRECKKPIYIGQTKRSIGKRFEEHNTDCQSGVLDEKDKPVPFHMITNGHQLSGVKLLREVRNPLQLDACESLHLFKKNKGKVLVNKHQFGNCNSPLFAFCKS